MRVLVIGGRGFIGSKLAGFAGKIERLVKQTCIVRPPEMRKSSPGPVGGFRFHLPFTPNYRACAKDMVAIRAAICQAYWRNIEKSNAQGLS